MQRALAISLLAFTLRGQGLTLDQKLADFQNLAATYAKQYGPADWKRDALGVDIYNLTPWQEKIRRTTTDLQFYDVMREYVAALQDGHSGYFVPSSFVARLQFTVDIYDGKLLVDSINRTRLPGAEFPFAIGYELVSVDGEDAFKILDRLEPYDNWAYQRATRRAAAALITTRPQQLIPNGTSNLPDNSTVVFRRPDGQLETYRLPWNKSGLPLVTPGAIPSFSGASNDSVQPGEESPELEVENLLPGYQPFGLIRAEVPAVKAVNGQGATAPLFLGGMGARFQRRLGQVAGDPFYSGVIPAGPYKIGFLRIPTFSPADFNVALAAFQREIIFFQANTDGLILDVMRNGGGSVDYANTLLSLLLPTRYRTLGYEVKSNSGWVVSISSFIESVKAQGAPASFLAPYEKLKAELIAANAEGRLTVPIALDAAELERDPLRDNRGNLLAYTKPLMVITDEFAASASEQFAATIQDNGRGIVFGWRTPGLGGTVVSQSMGTFSQGFFSYTQTLMNRKAPVVTSEFPAAPYIENIGVRPDITEDYMTRANLANQGRPFADTFTAAMVAHIEKSK